MAPHQKSEAQVSASGRTFTLVVGVGLLVGAGVVALSGGAPVIATILVLVGASTLSGWVRARPKKTPPPDAN